MCSLHGRCAAPCCLPAHLFREDCLYHDLHLFRRSSRNVCNSRSVAVGGARLHLRCATKCFENEQPFFFGGTMLGVILLTSALYALSSLQNRTSSQIWFGRRGSNRAPAGRYALCCSRAHYVTPLLERLHQAQVGPDEWWASGVSSLLLPYLFRASLCLFFACCLIRGSTP